MVWAFIIVFVLWLLLMALLPPLVVSIAQVKSTHKFLSFWGIVVTVCVLLGIVIIICISYIEFVYIYPILLMYK